MRKLAATLLGCLFLLPCAGCGSRTGTTYTTATLPVKGKVTLNGKPVTKGTVTFEPDSGREAHGNIQSDGTYVLTTFKEGDGAVPGTHRVAVSNAGRTVPNKFANVSSSKIEIEVSEGKTDYPIDLK